MLFVILNYLMYRAMWLKRLVRMLSISESLIKKQNKTSKISMKGNENIMQKNAIIKNFFLLLFRI